MALTNLLVNANLFQTQHGQNYHVRAKNEKTGLEKESYISIDQDQGYVDPLRKGNIRLRKSHKFYYPNGDKVYTTRQQKQIKNEVKDTTIIRVYDKDGRVYRKEIDTSSLYKPPIAPQQGLIPSLTTLAAKAVPSNMNSSEVSLLSPPARDEILQHRHGAPELQAKVLAAKFNENRAVKKELRQKSNRLAFHISPSSPLTKGLTWVRSLTNAATNIQRIFRGFRVRQELKRLENSTRNGN